MTKQNSHHECATEDRRVRGNIGCVGSVDRAAASTTTTRTPFRYQELRRWRKEATANVDTDHNRSPPLSPRKAPVVSGGGGSGRRSTPSSLGGPPKPLPAYSRLGVGPHRDDGDDGATPPPPRSSREFQDSRYSGWHHGTSSSSSGGGSSEGGDGSRSNADSGSDGDGDGSDAGVSARSRTQGSSNGGDVDVRMRRRGAVRSGSSAQLDAPPPAASASSALAAARYGSPQQPLCPSAGDHAAAMSSGNERWRSRLDSERARGGMGSVPEGGGINLSRVKGPVRGTRDGVGGGQEERESNTEASLDLSDCSDEVRWEKRRGRLTHGEHK